MLDIKNGYDVMDIYLYDTLTKEKRKFEPLKNGEVSIYNCGPTVYDYAHIGNFRTFIMADLLRRIFEYNNYKIHQVMNITDVDDKTIKKSQSLGKNLSEVTKEYEEIFFKDLDSLNIKRPLKTPRATENIKEMVEMIETLLEKGVAYKSSDGIYFDITKSENYGKLANLNLENSTKERIQNDEYDKENPRDFSLWKFYTEEDGDVSYDAPFGKGRPGWHIECSAMSRNELGETLDIHTGGQDLIFPHHTNEIAQSEGASGHKFVNYWIHGGFITVEGKKMSKSLGNIYTLETLKEKGVDPLAFRYFVLGAHYRSPLNFTWEALEGAKTALRRLKQKINSESKNVTYDKNKIDEIINNNRNNFLKYINDDLSLPFALSYFINDVANGILPKDKKRELFIDFDRVLGLKLDEVEDFEIPEEVKKLIEERDIARKNKDFQKSDELREKIESFGFEVKDTDEGTRLSPR